MVETDAEDGYMTRQREHRNRLIKREIQRLLEDGFSLKEARYIVAEKYYLTAEHVKRIYYETGEIEN